MPLKGLVRIVLAAFAATVLVVPAMAEEALTPAQQDAVRALVRDVLQKNPELVMEALETLHSRQEQAKQQARSQLLVDNRERLINDPQSPVLGNPDGDVTVVEFMDYRCGYCKRVFLTVQELIAEDPKVRVVIKELPILGPDSVLAAKAALAIWNSDPKKYTDFHSALLTARGALSESRITKIAADMGLDAAAVEKAMKADPGPASLSENVSLARALGISGTPAFVIGKQLVPGAIGLDTLRGLVEEARKG